MKYILKLVLLLAFFVVGNNMAFAETYPELCVVFNRTLKQGDVGQDVKRLQIVLGQEGIAYLASTGYYGPATAAAVKVFQQRNAIYPVGKVGPQTLRFMKNLWCFGGDTYIPIDTRNPELPQTGWNNGGSNWNNSGTPEVSLQPVSSQNNSVTISWNTRAVNSCAIQQDNGNLQNLQSSTGQQVFTLYGESRFTLKCMGFNGREYSKTILVRPNQAISNLPWVNVSITPSQVLIGQQATLYWTSQNTTYCTSTGTGNSNYNSNLQPSGSIPVTINSGTNTFTFTCYNQTGQSVSQTITANSTQQAVPVINNFTYSNNYLAWGTANVNSCTLSGGNLSNQNVQTNGNQYVATPNSNTIWTLTCFGNNNQSVTRQVNYNIYTSCIQNNTCTNTGSNTITADSNTDLQTYRAQVGQTFSVICPANLALANVWGSDVYSDDSSVCSAAVHAGKISQTSGGIVSVVIGGPQNSFTALSRNGVTSISYSYWPGSFTFVGGSTCTTNCGTVGSFSATNNNGTINLTWSNNQANTSNQCSLYRHSALGPTDASYHDGSKVLLATGLGNSGNFSTVYVGTSGNWLAPGYMQFTLDCGGSKLFTYVAGASVTEGSAPSVSVTANPSSVTSGQSVNINLVGSGMNVVSACTLTGGNSNNINIPVTSTSGGNYNFIGNITITPSVSGTYTVTCQNSTNGQVATANTYITVSGNNTGAGNMTANIYANPTYTTYSGQPVTLSWSSANATYCNVYTGNTNLNNQPTSGSTTVYPTVNTSYYVTCYNSNNQSVQSNTVSVTVAGGNTGVPTVNISASPNPVGQGQLTNLTWYSTNSNYCNIIGGNTNLANQPVNGSYAVSPSQSTNYTITCYNNNGQNASSYVYVTRY